MTVFQILDFNDIKSSLAVMVDPIHGYQGGLIKYIGVYLPNDDLIQWLEYHVVEAVFYTTIEWTTTVSMLSDGSIGNEQWNVPRRSKLMIEILDPHHAMLFKLTWI